MESSSPSRSASRASSRTSSVTSGRASARSRPSTPRGAPDVLTSSRKRRGSAHRVPRPRARVRRLRDPGSSGRSSGTWRNAFGDAGGGRSRDGPAERRHVTAAFADDGRGMSPRSASALHPFATAFRAARAGPRHRLRSSRRHGGRHRRGDRAEPRDDRDDLAAGAVHVGRPSRRPRSPGRRSHDAGRGTRDLVIDDEAGIVEMLSIVFGKRGTVSARRDPAPKGSRGFERVLRLV